jgi:hypothetical protein
MCASKQGSLLSTILYEGWKEDGVPSLGRNGRRVGKEWNNGRRVGNKGPQERKNRYLSPPGSVRRGLPSYLPSLTLVPFFPFPEGDRDRMGREGKEGTGMEENRIK